MNCIPRSTWVTIKPGIQLSTVSSLSDKNLKGFKGTRTDINLFLRENREPVYWLREDLIIEPKKLLL